MGYFFYYVNTKSGKWYGYFLFKCWYEFIGYGIFLAFYSQVWYTQSSVFTRIKIKLVSMLR